MNKETGGTRAMIRTNGGTVIGDGPTSIHQKSGVIRALYQTLETVSMQLLCAIDRLPCISPETP